MLFALILTVVLAGDSTMVGTVSNHVPIKPKIAYNRPEVVLADLLTRLPDGHRYKNAQVVNMAIGGTSSRDWGSYVQGYFCSLSQSIPLVHMACQLNLTLAEAIAPTLGYVPAIMLMTIGTNDAIWGVTLEESVANVEALETEIIPAVLLLAPPFVAAPGSGNPLLAAQERVLGLITGPDFGSLPLPLSDTVHLTDGGYVAAMGMWFDKLIGVP